MFPQKLMKDRFMKKKKKYIINFSKKQIKTTTLHFGFVMTEYQGGLSDKIMKKKGLIH